MDRFYSWVRRHVDIHSPGWINIFTNPFWLNRRAIHGAVARLGSALDGRIVDFGCGSAPYRGLLVRCREYIGLDFDSSRARAMGVADLYYDGITIPLPDGSVDGLLSTESLEHVPNPERIVSEWARICRDGGRLLVTVPLMWPEHEVPWDYHRFTAYGLRGLLERNGFEVLEAEKLLPDYRAIVQLFLAWFFDVFLARRSRLARLSITAVFCAPITLGACLLAAVLPANPNTYLGNVMLAQRTARKDEEGM